MSADGYTSQMHAMDGRGDVRSSGQNEKMEEEIKTEGQWQNSKLVMFDVIIIKAVD